MCRPLILFRRRQIYCTNALEASTASHGKSIGTEHNKLNNSFLVNYFREREKKTIFQSIARPRFTGTINNHCYIYDKFIIGNDNRRKIYFAVHWWSAHSLARWRRTQREQARERERNRLSSSSTIRRYIVEVHTHPRAKPFNFMLNNLPNWLFPWYSLAMFYAKGVARDGRVSYTATHLRISHVPLLFCSMSN